MNFNNKIASFFTNFSLELGTIPSKRHIHLYADYVELVSLFSNQNYISSSDILDRFQDEGIIKQKKADSDQSEANDDDERFINSIYRLIIERAQIFKDDYPFKIEGIDKIRLKENAVITPRNEIYIYLLISSSLNIFSDFQTELTTEFEEISAEVLKNFLPAHAIVKSFGKNSDYTGTAAQKIKALAKDVKIEIDNDAFEEISNKGTQEKGLDLIGWVPFEDNVSNLLIILVQCACGKEWYKKQGETSRYNNYLKFHRLTPIHSMFIPYNLVSYNKKTFFANDEIDNRLIFERKRIMNYIHDTDFFKQYESKTLVDKCIEIEEDIV
ncbi:hypothetical protein [Myroides marinus]|uniref:hypothetical protein n=1 Tax=Myroides marinus TaxID=703342 RepID=UPI002574EEE0|nr:hypothetical protein [Myroides marinus]MDM1377710.1 hypothetical protein [Myroides marinus]MDM1385086.1 hypothetical protein [Myroides marinus]MDM1392194.1 hypothetical protein [Myroides marinus]